MIYRILVGEPEGEWLYGRPKCRSMGFAGYVTICLHLYCVSCHCLILHVSAYMTICKCVLYFYFHMPEGCFAGLFFFVAFFHMVTLHVSICVFLCCFSSLILLFLACMFVCLLFLCCLSVLCRWQDNIKINIKQMPLEGVNLINMAQDLTSVGLLWAWWLILTFNKSHVFSKEQLCYLVCVSITFNIDVFAGDRIILWPASRRYRGS
jgi:hypothetical protein